MHIDTAIPCIVILIVIDVHTDQGMRVTGRSCHELNNHARRIRTQDPFREYGELEIM